VHELWALPANGAAPVSLGLLPQTGSRKVALDPVQAAALLAAGQLAVSREPAGGSPTGAPTGPVLIVSKRLPLA
jgi:anti-sigma-K factor RskA